MMERRKKQVWLRGDVWPAGRTVTCKIHPHKSLIANAIPTLANPCGGICQTGFELRTSCLRQPWRRRVDLFSAIALATTDGLWAVSYQFDQIRLGSSKSG
jgi:hypothetical protein